MLVVGRNHEERDEACTRASHYDILRYRPEEEARQLFGERYWPRISGTEKNERRRKSGVGLLWMDPPENSNESPIILLVCRSSVTNQVTL